MAGMRLVVGVIVSLFATTVLGQQNVCFNPPETGNCRAFLPSFYYNPQLGVCDCFIFGGCNSGGNQFGNLESCMQTCSVSPSSQRVTNECVRIFGNSAGAFGGNGGGSVSQNTIQQTPERQVPSSLRRPDRCFVSPETGTCRALIPSYYFNPQTGSCDCFAFGGCRPNPNNFASVRECMQTCLVEPSEQFLSNECIRLFGNTQTQQPQQPGQGGQTGSTIDPDFIRQNLEGQNFGSQNFGNTNGGGSQNFGNTNGGGSQNFGPVGPPTQRPFIAPAPTTFAPRPRPTTEVVRDAPPGSITRLTPVSAVIFSPSGTETGQLTIGQPVRISG